MSTAKKNKAIPATEWETFFRQAKVRAVELDGCKSVRSKAIRMGKFLSQMVGRIVPIQVNERTGAAELRLVEGRGREKRYDLLVRWDPEVTNIPAPVADAKSTGAKAAAAPSVIDRGLPTGRSADRHPGKAVAKEGGRANVNTKQSEPLAPTTATKPTAGGNSEQW